MSGARRVAEELEAGPVPLWVHPAWRERFPGLAQGTTGRGAEDAPFDLGLFGAQPVGAALDRWERLRRASGMRRVVHSRQVHRNELATHGAEGVAGLLVSSGHDGHLTAEPGVLLAVSVADCIPVSLVDGAGRAVALVHAGWRGVAAGIVEGAVSRLESEFGVPPADLWVHCGPAICGACYEVGPEVHAAVDPGPPPPPRPTPIDLRASVARRVAALGVPAERTSVSAHCTRCGPGAFFSHRGGSAARQMGVLGLRG